MACFNPLRGWRSLTANESGKRSIVFKKDRGFEDLEVQIPCGQCIGCRLERSRQWAIRCVHEASLYDDNCFITLTYDDDHLPKDKSLDVRDFQKFMKRLRKKATQKIRYYHCGEYGEECAICGHNRMDCKKLGCTFIKTLGRPHFHACVFNYDFDDKILHSKDNGIPIYTSEKLSNLWPMGFALTGDVTFESAAYVARYVTKKIYGDDAPDYYQYKKPEYTSMSNGIGAAWYDLFKSDLDHDFCIINGKEVKIPKYYDSILGDSDHFELLKRKAKRKTAAEQHAADNSIRRLRDREQCQTARFTKLQRNYEGTNHD